MASQRLFRRLCEACRIPETPRPDEVTFHATNAHPQSPPLTKLWRAGGCDLCTGTGYRDRIGVFELVRMSDALRTVLTARGSAKDLLRIAAAEGTRTLAQEALHLVAGGVTSLEEVTRSRFGGGPA
jgi:type IV pilus assembly protein PilB